jgi:hypothetical protein
MSTESDAVDAAIADVAKYPKRMRGDEGEVEEFSLEELIRAARYLANKDKVAAGNGWKINKIEAPGAHP